LKVVNLNDIDPGEDMMNQYKNEVQLLDKLKDCELVAYLYASELRESENKLFMLMEKGDISLQTILFPFIPEEKELKPVDPLTAKFYFREMVKAVEQIHYYSVVHIDLKPENFVLINGKVKLVDFDTSNIILENQTNIYKEFTSGTVEFLPPEALTLVTVPMFKDTNITEGIKYNCKADIWSLGCILYYMVTGHTPYQYYPDMKRAIINSENKIDYSNITDPILLDCITKCLERKPMKRPTASQLLQHPYLTDV